MVRIAGAGLAGSAAALGALAAGAPARLWDPSRLPKHKVCGEFLTPEIEETLQKVGIWDAFLHQKPAKMRRMKLHFGRRSAESTFPEPAWGLSRYRLDVLLRGEAVARGAEWIAERVPGDVEVLASGRQAPAPAGAERLFGFKAHFLGPESEAVELFFFNDFYVGVNPVEEGRTNVCGLGTEAALRRVGFDYDSLIDCTPGLAERVRPLSRAIDWLSCGPVVYRPTPIEPPSNQQLVAGDALQFVDPFTGTGMTIAIWTGALAGRWAAEKRPIPDYYAQVREALDGQYNRCARLRQAMGNKWLMSLAPLLPPRWLYYFTRPKLESR